MLIDARNSALLVVDVQGRLVPAIAGWQALLDHVVWLIRVARRMDVPVLACEQYPQGLDASAGGSGTAARLHRPQAAFLGGGRRLP
jgi:nicotinamidase-related amidase